MVASGLHTTPVLNVQIHMNQKIYIYHCHACLQIAELNQ